MSSTQDRAAPQTEAGPEYVEPPDESVWRDVVGRCPDCGRIIRTADLSREAAAPALDVERLRALLLDLSPHQLTGVDLSTLRLWGGHIEEMRRIVNAVRAGDRDRWEARSAELEEAAAFALAGLNDPEVLGDEAKRRLRAVLNSGAAPGQAGPHDAGEAGT